MLLVAWWPGILTVPGAALAVVTLLGSLTTLSALWVYWRRGGAAEALRLAKQVQEQQQALIDAQHETNVDIDRRLRESAGEREQMARHIGQQAHQLAVQASEIDNLKTGRAIQDHRLARIEAERDWLRQRLTRILDWLTASGIALPDDLKQDSAPPTP